MSPDPPIGRLGYIFSGDGGHTTDGRKEFFCMGCKSWQQARFFNCPECEWSRPGFNKHIRSTQLDNNLREYAGAASNQASMAPITSNVNLPH